MAFLYNRLDHLANHPKTQDLVKAVLPYRLWLIIGVHVLLLLASYLSSFLMLDELLPEDGWALFWRTVWLVVPIRLAIFAYHELFRGLWAFVSFTDLINILRSVAISTLLFALAGMFWEPVRVPQKIVLLDMVFCVVLVGGIRFVVRNFRESFVRDMKAGDREHVLLVGPVERVQMTVKEMLSDPYARFHPLAVMDPNAHDGDGISRISDIPVYSMAYAESHPHVLKGLDSIVLCWPGATQRQLDRVLQDLEPLRLPYKTLPHIDDILSGKVSINDIRDVEIDDLLERPPIQISMSQIHESIHDKVVMVTGGGGSIGSELCRQLAAFEPRLLVIVERAEENLHKLSLELRKTFPALSLQASISSVNDLAGLVSLIKETRVDIVFHAAAYKHVPLMEVAPIESAYNNVLGTYNVAKAALEGGVERFVMISTDKAVNPTNVMGATKRIAEMLVQNFNSRHRTRFMVVRFGNVLGSAGSVIPVFNRQIAQGGPVTVTHPDIERYFMTIPEAVQLVLEAGCMGQGGEIFVLDMGQPVGILRLAEKLISLSGKRPYDDIEIVFTGLRPGEKMFEELFNVDEKRMETAHPQILMALSMAVDRKEIASQLERIRESVRQRDVGALLNTFKETVPNYVNGSESDGQAAGDGKEAALAR